MPAVGYEWILSDCITTENSFAAVELSSILCLKFLLNIKELIVSNLFEIWKSKYRR